MSTTPPPTPDQPSAGAVRAALALIREENRVFMSNALRDKYVNFLARLIDRETHAKETLAALKSLDAVWFDPKQMIPGEGDRIRGVVDSVIAKLEVRA